MNFLEKLLGIGDTRHRHELDFSTPRKTATPPPSPSQIKDINASIEADGARMFNQAHPNQIYRTNQNNEFAAGQLPSYMTPGTPNYIGHLLPATHPPTLTVQTLRPQPLPYASINDIQGLTNPGYTPLQGSDGVRPFQGGY